jgi:hypothetical protein
LFTHQQQQQQQLEAAPPHMAASKVCLATQQQHQATAGYVNSSSTSSSSCRHRYSRLPQLLQFTLDVPAREFDDKIWHQPVPFAASAAATTAADR